MPVPRRGLIFLPVGEIVFRIYVKRGAFADTPFPELPFAIPTSKIEEAQAMFWELIVGPTNAYREW